MWTRAWRGWSRCSSVKAVSTARSSSRSPITEKVLAITGEGEHGLFLYESCFAFPWIMRLPGRASAGRVVDEQVRSPRRFCRRIAELLGVRRYAERVDGESLAAVVKGETPGVTRHRRTRKPTIRNCTTAGASFARCAPIGGMYIDAPKAGAV